MKNPMTPAGIEQATFRFVAQHLNHCATAVFHKGKRYYLKEIHPLLLEALKRTKPNVTSVENNLRCNTQLHIQFSAFVGSCTILSLLSFAQHKNGLLKAKTCTCSWV